jgi:molybdopterin-guanine dinucleotide biosynthesis protein A
MHAEPATSIVILAGGAATRFPGKLEREVGGEPMLLRVYRNARQSRWPVYVAGKGSFSPEIDARLECPLLLDRRPGGGPLQALLSACGAVDAERIFVLAGDSPLVDTSVMEALAAAWQPGDEAVVPVHAGRIEPLAGLYARSAVLHEAFTIVEHGSGAMHALIERLNARFVEMPERHFVNVNTPADLARLGAV